VIGHEGAVTAQADHDYDDEKPKYFSDKMHIFVRDEM